MRMGFENDLDLFSAHHPTNITYTPHNRRHLNTADNGFFGTAVQSVRHGAAQPGSARSRPVFLRVGTGEPGRRAGPKGPLLDLNLLLQFEKCSHFSSA